MIEPRLLQPGTPPPAARGFRMPAEWEPHDATWLAWPVRESDWPGKFPLIPFVYAEILRHLTRFERVHLIVPDAATEVTVKNLLQKSGVNLNAVQFWLLPTDRSWLRDSGPIYLVSAQGQSIRFSEDLRIAGDPRAGHQNVHIGKIDIVRLGPRLDSKLTSGFERFSQVRGALAIVQDYSRTEGLHCLGDGHSCPRHSDHGYGSILIVKGHTIPASPGRRGDRPPLRRWPGRKPAATMDARPTPCGKGSDPRPDATTPATPRRRSRPRSRRPGTSSGASPGESPTSPQPAPACSRAASTSRRCAPAASPARGCARCARRPTASRRCSSSPRPAAEQAEPRTHGSRALRPRTRSPRPRAGRAVRRRRGSRRARRPASLHLSPPLSCGHAAGPA